MTVIYCSKFKIYLKIYMRFAYSESRIFFIILNVFIFAEV